MDPFHGASLLNIGMVHVKCGRYDEAVPPLRAALRIEPDLAEAHNNLGLAYAGKGLYADEEKEFRAALEIDPGQDEVRQEIRRAGGQSR